MTLVKTSNGQVEQFPYSLGDLRRDNPQTSFPKDIPVEILSRYGVFPVEVLSKPEYDYLVQKLKKDDTPHKEVIRFKTKEDATDPTTGEVDLSQVGTPIYGNKWIIGYTVENLTQEQAEKNIKEKRNRLLTETDWRFRSDMTPSQEWKEYCQALRDITDQETFPYSVTWPTTPL